MKHGSLFSGIGGFDLAAEWMGWENVFHCELSEINRRVLKYYWPNANSHEDIKTTDFSIYRGKIDILTGGFPCQPYSSAGSRRGKDDDRHLWPEMLRAIREIKPTWILGENVSGLLNWGKGIVFDEIQNDLETEGYQVQPCLLPALSVEADHIRERVWIVAYSGCLGWSNAQGNKRTISNEAGFSKRGRQKSAWGHKEANVMDSPCNTFLRFEELYGESPLCSLDDGFSFGLDGITDEEYIKAGLAAAGNAVVPQVVLEIFKIIQIMQDSAL